MRELYIVFIVFCLSGCSSVQQKIFDLENTQDFSLENSEPLKFDLLCEQLSVIAYMNLLDNLPTPDLSKQNQSCQFVNSEPNTGYSFAFTYNSSEDEGYSGSTQTYPSKSAHSKKTIELSATQLTNSVEISLKSTNHDKTFNKLSFLINKLLKQEYNAYYTPTATKDNYQPTKNSYYD